MKLSLVTTLYCSRETIRTFHARATAAAQALVGDDYELIFVNDGSPDDVLSIAELLCQEDEHLSVIDLSRNFGHHYAMMTGLRFARGDYVFALDDDLEEDPAWLSAFWARMQETHADHVYGVQVTRKGGFFERVSGALFYRLFNWLSDAQIPNNQIMAKLMTRRFVDALLTFEERTLFLAGVLALTGFTQVALPCTKTSKGRSTYTFARKVDQAVNSITSFSTKPLSLIFCAGLLLSLISVLVLGFLVVRKLAIGTIMDGWTSIMATMTFGFGATIAVLGILGIYLSKIFLEVKKRPFVIVRAVLHKNTNKTNAKGV